MPTLEGTVQRLACNQSSKTVAEDFLSGEQPLFYKKATARLQCALFLDTPEESTLVTDVSNITSAKLAIRKGGPTGTLLVTKTITSSAVGATTWDNWVVGTDQHFEFVLSAVDTNHETPSNGKLRIYFTIRVTTASSEYVAAHGYGIIQDVGITDDVATPTPPAFTNLYVDGAGVVQNPLVNFPSNSLFQDGVPIHFHIRKTFGVLQLVEDLGADREGVTSASDAFDEGLDYFRENNFREDYLVEGVPAATSSPGGTILMPNGTFKIDRSIDVHENNVYIIGQGQGQNSTRDEEATRILFDAAAAPAPMVIFRSLINVPAGAGRRRGQGGISRVTLDCNSRATRGLEINSWRDGVFEDLRILYATVAGVFTGALTNALNPGSTQRCYFRNVNVECLNAIGWHLTGAISGNTSFCTFNTCRAYVAEAIAWLLESTDNCTFIALQGDTSPGFYSLVLGSQDDNSQGGTGYCRQNQFFGIEMITGVHAKASQTGGNSSGSNVIHAYSRGNGAPAPVLQEGANGSRDAQLFVWSRTGVEKAGSRIASVGTTKNYLDNPSFEHWQEKTAYSGLVGLSNIYVADRWSTRYSSGSAYGVTREAGFAGSRYCLRVTRALGSVTTAGNFLSQRIDDALVPFLAGKMVTLSGWFRAGPDFGANINIYMMISTGTLAGDTFGWAPMGFTTGQVSSGSKPLGMLIPGQAIFGEDAVYKVPADAKTLYLHILWNSGTSAATVNDYVEFSNLKLEIGAQSSLFDPPNVQADLAACQRYYRKSFALATAPAQNVGAGTGEHTSLVAIAGAVANRMARVQFAMRKAPTVTLFNPEAASAQVRNITDGANATSSAATNITESGFDVTYVGNAAGSVGDLVGVHWVADARS